MYRTICCDGFFFFFFQAEDGIRDKLVTGVQTCALPILGREMIRAGPLRPRPPVDERPGVGRVLQDRADGGDGRAAPDDIAEGIAPRDERSEERRVGKECRSRWSPYQ